jgi:hypothetical protein
LKGLIVGFLVVFLADWWLYPFRMAWIDLSWPGQNFRFLTTLTKALVFGAPLGWNSWSAWREWKEGRWPAAKTRLRCIGWSLLLIQMGCVVCLIIFKKSNFSSRWVENEGWRFLLICAFNLPLMWALFLTLASAFMPAKDKHQVQITKDLRL